MKQANDIRSIYNDTRQSEFQLLETFFENLIDIRIAKGHNMFSITDTNNVLFLNNMLNWSALQSQAKYFKMDLDFDVDNRKTICVADIQWLLESYGYQTTYDSGTTSKLTVRW